MLAFLLVIEDEKKREKLEQIYDLYHKDMYHAAYAVLKDHHDAEDMVQSSLIKLLDILHQIEEVKCKKTRAFLVIIVRNMSITFFNKRRKKYAVNIETLSQSQIDETADIENFILQLEQSKMLAKAFKQIHPEYGDLLTLRYYMDYSLFEIGEILELTENNVGVKLYRAKKALKKVLENGGEYDESCFDS